MIAVSIRNQCGTIEMMQLSIRSDNLAGRDGHGSDLGQVQLDLNPDPNFCIGPRPRPRSVGSENFGPGLRPLGSGGSRVWIWVQKFFFYS